MKVLTKWCVALAYCMRRRFAETRMSPGATPAAVHRTPNDMATADGSTLPKTKERRLCADALYALAVVGAVAGFALIGRDVEALYSARTAVSAGHSRSDPNASARGLAPDALESTGFAAPTDANAWAEAIGACARPGSRVQSLVESFRGTPAQRIAQVYLWTAQHWKYEPDRDRDWLIPAETLLQPGNLRGDCKAIAILLAASSAQLGIATRIVATRALSGQAGHVQTQVLLCRPGEDPTPVIDRMAAVWSQPGQTPDFGRADLPLVLTSEGWFLALDGGPPPKRIDGLGPVEVTVSSASRATK